MKVTISKDKQWAKTGPDTWIRLDKVREISLGEFDGRCEVRASFESSPGEVVLGDYEDRESAVVDINRQLDIVNRDQSHSV